MATKLDHIMKGKFSLNATNASNAEEEFRHEKYQDKNQDEHQKKGPADNDESNLEDGSANANLSEIIQTNKLSISRRAVNTINE